MLKSFMNFFLSLIFFGVVSVGMIFYSISRILLSDLSILTVTGIFTCDFEVGFFF